MPAGKCGKVVCTGDGSRDQPILETRAWKTLFSNRCNSTVEILEKGLEKKIRGNRVKIQPITTCILKLVNYFKCLSDKHYFLK